MFRKKESWESRETKLREPKPPNEDEILRHVAYEIHNGLWFEANGITYDIIYSIMARKILALQGAE